MEMKWTTHEDPQGFTLEMPAGWRVSTDVGIINVSGTDSEQVTILPLKTEAQLDANLAWYVLTNLSRKFWPHQKWDIPKRGWQFSANGVRMVGSDESVLRQTNALWWANTGEGATGFFYGVAAPPARFQSLETVFARILQSFRVTHVAPLAGSAPQEELQFERWADPTEMAFSTEVPVGWRTTGGIVRPNLVSKSEIVMQSPDSRVTVRIDDVNVYYQYVEPNMTLLNGGMWEGMVTSDGTFIRHYQTGLDFADEYVKNTVGRNAQNLRLLKSTDRPDYTNAVAWYAQFLGWVRHTAGEVTYAYEFDNQTYIIYQFAETAVTHFSSVATMWNLQRLNGFVAPVERASQADAVLQRAVTSLQMNPEWLRLRARINAQVAEQNRNYNEYVSNLWKQTQAHRSAVWDRISERRGDVLSDMTRVVDPETRQAYKVQSGSSYYWIDPVRNVIAGTDLPYAPTWDFRGMLQTYD